MLKELLTRFFVDLANGAIEYCVIGNYQNLPEYTSNDVDVWVSDFKGAEQYLMARAREVGLVLYMANRTANGSNNYFYRQGKDSIDVVKIDLLTELSYKSVVPIVQSQCIKKNIVKYKDFCVANEVMEAVMHLLYPLVTFGVVKHKYREKLQRISMEEEFSSTLLAIIGVRLGSRILESLRIGEWDSIAVAAKDVRYFLIIKMFKSLDKVRVKTIGAFIGALFRRSLKKNGIVVALIGIDGAGKTSIKERLANVSNKYFAKERRVEYYWRPFLLPKISTIVGLRERVQHYDGSGRRLVDGKLSTVVISVAKYFYYVVDFVVGQAKYFKVCHTGGIVIFDRYHLDNIVYPERFGFVVNRGFMRWVDKVLVPQPDIIFYLSASARHLYQRKNELDVDEIARQKKEYKREIEGRHDVVTIDTGVSIENSVDEILMNCFRVMSRRYPINSVVKTIE